MSGRHKPRMPQLPRLRRPAEPYTPRHRRAAEPPPPPPQRARTRSAEPRRTAREEIARRPSTARLSGSDTPARRNGVETGRGRELARNYPAPSPSAIAREKQRSPHPTRKQLADRKPMGQPHHDERAALLARSSSYSKGGKGGHGKATGRAGRPAAQLPTADPVAGSKPVEAGRRHPAMSGRVFSDRTTERLPGFAGRFFS